MNNIIISVYHPTLDLLSDRTFRDLLKKLSSLGRELQAQEALQFVKSSFLSNREKQSIRDRIKPDLDHIPAYYVERVERGSLTVTISITAFAIWLLQNTVGKSIEYSWRRTRFHKSLVSYLSSDERQETIKNNVELVINNWAMDRFLIESVQKSTDSNGNIVVEILLKTDEETEALIREKSEKVDVEYVLQNARRLLADLEQQQDENGNGNVIE